MCKYPKVARGQDGVEVKSMIDLLLVKKAILCCVQYVKAVRGMEEVSQIIMLYCVKLGWWGHGSGVVGVGVRETSIG